MPLLSTLQSGFGIGELNLNPTEPGDEASTAIALPATGDTVFTEDETAGFSNEKVEKFLTGRTKFVVSAATCNKKAICNQKQAYVGLAQKSGLYKSMVHIF